MELLLLAARVPLYSGEVKREFCEVKIRDSYIHLCLRGS